MQIISVSGEPIESVDDWLRLAPPARGLAHWKDGRSAKELAKAWFASGAAQVPDELAALLKSHPATAALKLESGTPEVVTKLDNYRGAARHHDLVLVGRAAGVCTLVAVEAKADEPFDDPIAKRLAKSSDGGSNLPQRIDLLCRSIFGRPCDAALGQLRYQLLHGVAGTLIEASKQEATQAVFVVHEFLSAGTDPEKAALNAQDLERFVRTLPGGAAAELRHGQLGGPIMVPGGEFVPVHLPLFVGKVTTWLDRQTS